MARDAAIITTWGSTVRGREAKSLEVFNEFMIFWGKQAADGKCQEPEVYFAYDGSDGMSIVKGKSDALMELWESEEYEKLISRAQFIVDDLKAHLWITGDEEIARGTQIYAESGSQLGYW